MALFLEWKNLSFYHEYTYIQYIYIYKLLFTTEGFLEVAVKN